MAAILPSGTLLLERRLVSFREAWETYVDLRHSGTCVCAGIRDAERDHNPRIGPGCRLLHRKV